MLSALPRPARLTPSTCPRRRKPDGASLLTLSFPNSPSLGSADKSSSCFSFYRPSCRRLLCWDFCSTRAAALGAFRGPHTRALVKVFPGCFLRRAPTGPRFFVNLKATAHTVQCTSAFAFAALRGELVSYHSVFRVFRLFSSFQALPPRHGVERRYFALQSCGAVL